MQDSVCEYKLTFWSLKQFILVYKSMFLRTRNATDCSKTNFLAKLKLGLLQHLIDHNNIAASNDLQAAVPSMHRLSLCPICSLLLESLKLPEFFCAKRGSNLHDCCPCAHRNILLLYTLHFINQSCT
jgi:hypothetical protein